MLAPLSRITFGVVVLAVTLTGCSHLPWHHAPAGPAPRVTELVVEGAGGASAPTLPQTWDRNTLRVDLSSVAGEGELTLRPLQGHDWPIRLEFAVRPGSFAHLEIRGEQRVILSVAASGLVSTVTVPQGTYAPATKELIVRYGP